MSDESRKIRITGRVQGVGFRAWTQGHAEKLGLKGWVRNEEYGSVLALISGPRDAVSQMETDFWQGPGSADVRDVQSEIAAPPDRAGFEIRH
ncbi:acylphosphatase [Pseudooceanicola sp. LIPI14-2-Ac024]|uniref:acylphosphatase n=1 Tax=Pseudooceanicola sp. LIPI14-2-Ac024 TaxID=3344875 RepID=UPI0035CED982